MAQFIKQGNNYYRKDENGNLFNVSDPETIKGLSSGQLPFQGIPNDRGLKFADETTPAPNNTPSSTTGTTADIGSVLKNKLITALNAYKGVSDTSQLEQKRQELLRKQLLSSPYSEEGEKNLTGSAKLSLLRSKGSEFEPEIKSIEEQIIKARNGDTASLAGLSKLVELGKDMGLFGAEGGYQSALGKEYADYVANEKANGNKKIMTLNEYANMDANRKRAITGGGESGLSASTLSKVQSIAQTHDSNQIVKDYSTIQNKAGSMQNILKSGVGGPGDLALVYEFMKALDPNSVVRETEYATAAGSGNIFRGWAARFNGYLKEQGGFLPPQVQKAFISIMNTKLAVAQAQYDNYHNEQARKINKITGGVDGIDYLTNYGAVKFEDVNKNKSEFDIFRDYITVSKADKKAYMPRSAWNQVQDKDKLLKEAKDDGYQLLITD